MNSVGIDLHKKTISICVVDQVRQIQQQRRFECSEPDRIRECFETLRPFQIVMEATASYEWLFRLLEPAAERAVLAHPKKLRIIAESTRKSDRLDAQVLGEFLALDMIPVSYRPTPRQREHRVLVRQRIGVQRRITSAKNRIRRILSNYNADRPQLFTRPGREYLKTVEVSAADRFVLDQIAAEYDFLLGQLRDVNRRLQEFAETAPVAEQEARAVLQSIPGVGTVTADVVLSELAGVDRFRSAKQVVAYAGLAPGQRESAGKSKELHIEKSGSKHLRWVLVEAAWQLVRRSRYWRIGIHIPKKTTHDLKITILPLDREILIDGWGRSGSGAPASAGPAWKISRLTVVTGFVCQNS